MPDDANFNPYNIRDISSRTDTITLETYCYKVFYRPDIYAPYSLKGIYPTVPDSVIFRYSIWGKLSEPNNINDKEKVEVESINCEVRTVLGDERVYIHYLIKESGPVLISIYDNLGNLVYSYNRNIWSDDGNNTHSLSLRYFPSGSYHVVVSDIKSISKCSFNFVR